MSEFYSLYQTVLMYAGVIGIALLVPALLMILCSDAWDRLKQFWHGLDGVGKFVCTFCVIGLTFYAATKPKYNDPPKVGADDGIDLWFVDVTYDTNTLHSTIKVVWTNGFDSAGINTPLAFRESSSNDWSVIEYPEDAIVYKLGISNILEFVESSTTNNYENFNHWWFGIDRPATEIIVTSDDLQIVDFQHDSECADFYIGMSEELMEIFNAFPDSYMTIQYSDDDGRSWVSVASTREFVVRVPGFWYGKDRIWRVVYVYQTGDDEDPDTRDVDMMEEEQ